jgi:hypothetical protein
MNKGIEINDAITVIDTSDNPLETIPGGHGGYHKKWSHGMEEIEHDSVMDEIARTAKESRENDTGMVLTIIYEAGKAVAITSSQMNEKGIKKENE